MGAVDAVFVAGPDLVRDVFRREGRHPRHLVPENWLIYNRKYGRKRGLFFM
jgi:ecdysteroid 2-hydroxylase